MNSDQLRLNEILSNLTGVIGKSTKSPSVHFDSYITSNVANSGVVIFDNLRDSSPQSGFDTSSGKFICPIDGTYFFEFYFRSSSSGGNNPGIYVDENLRCFAGAHETDRSHSCAIVVKLTKGQSVYIKKSTTKGIYGGIDDSGFLGFLISE